MAILKTNPILHIAVLVPAGGKEQNRQCTFNTLDRKVAALGLQEVQHTRKVILNKSLVLY